MKENKYIKPFDEYSLLDKELCEGLITSVNYDKFKHHLEKLLIKFNDLSYSISNEELYNKNSGVNISLTMLKMDKASKIDLYKKLNKLINNLGYFIYFEKDSFNLESFYKKRFVKILFNKKFDFPFNNKIDFLYHITLEDLWNKKIFRKGLIPKNRDIVSNYPNRIYFLKDYNDDDIKLLIEQKKNVLLKNKKYSYLDISKWVVLKIKIGRLNKLKLMIDPHYFEDEGLYTEDYIPAFAIEPIETLNI